MPPPPPPFPPPTRTLTYAENSKNNEKHTHTHTHTHTRKNKKPKGYYGNHGELRRGAGIFELSYRNNSGEVIENETNVIKSAFYCYEKATKICLNITFDNLQKRVIVDLTGPNDRWFSIAFGHSHFAGDCIVWTNGKTTENLQLTLWDYYLGGQEFIIFFFYFAFFFYIFRLSFSKTHNILIQKKKQQKNQKKTTICQNNKVRMQLH